MVSTESVNIVISADDNASKIFGQVENNANSSFGKIGGFATGAAKAIAGVGIAAGVAAGVGIYKATGAASDLGESINAVNVVFGEGADEILKFSEGAATAVGLSSREFNQLATETGTLVKATGLPLSNVADETVKLSKRAADLASVFNTDVGTAMSAVNQALRGETEAIRRFGSDVTDNSLKQFALSQGIEKSVSKMTQQEKTLLRLEKIMADTNQVQDDFINTSDSLANQQRIAAAETENMGAAIGQAFLPIAEKGMQLFRDLTSELFEFIGGTEGVQNAVDSMETIVSEKFEEFRPTLERFVEVGKEIFGNFKTAFEQIQPVIIDIAEDLGGFFKDNEDFFFNTLESAGNIAVGVFKLIGGVIKVFKDSWDNDFGGIQTSTKLLISTVQYFGSIAMSVFGGVINTVANVFSNWEFYWESMKLTLFNFVNFTISAVERWANEILKPINLVRKSLGQDLIKADFSGIKIDTELTEARVEGLRPEESIGDIWVKAGADMTEATEKYINDLREISKITEEREKTKTERDEEFLRAYREQQNITNNATQNITINARVTDDASVDALATKLQDKQRNSLSGLGVVVN